MQMTSHGSTTEESNDMVPGDERAALRSFRRAASNLAGYRRLLEDHDVDPRAVTRFDQVPFSDKRSVFGDDIGPWVDGGRLADAAELLTSSGASGHFSVGVTSRAERREQARAIDDALRALGASEHSSTLLLNCLPMGISFDTSLATIANPSVHMEMAIEILVRTGAHFDRVVIVAEPLFLKEFGETALRQHGPGFADRVVACFVGGEWASTSWRQYVASLFGFPSRSGSTAGVLISMGAAEVGLHVLVETPTLRVARDLINCPHAREVLFGSDEGYSPSLFTWNPKRVYLEERAHSDGSTTLAVTTLERRLLPLVRYDLDDAAQILDTAALNRYLTDAGHPPLPDEEPVVAVWGRRSARLDGPGWSVRPEPVKEALFASPGHAGALTGRFRVEIGPTGPHLHVQLRDGARPGPGLVGTLERSLTAVAGAQGSVFAYPHREYPFHEAGDFQHKPVYL